MRHGMGMAAVCAVAAGMLGTPAVASAGTPAACTAGDVTATLGTVVNESRAATAPVILTAHGGTNCTLQGFASNFVFTDAAGNTTPLSDGQVGTAGGPVTVTASAPAHLDVTWTVYPSGNPPLHPASLSFDLPGGGGTSTAAWTGGDVYGSFIQDTAIAAGSGQ